MDTVMKVRDYMYSDLIITSFRQITKARNSVYLDVA